MPERRNYARLARDDRDPIRKHPVLNRGGRKEPAGQDGRLNEDRSTQDDRVPDGHKQSEDKELVNRQGEYVNIDRLSIPAEHICDILIPITIYKHYLI